MPKAIPTTVSVRSDFVLESKDLVAPRLTNVPKKLVTSKYSTRNFCDDWITPRKQARYQALCVTLKRQPFSLVSLHDSHRSEPSHRTEPPREIMESVDTLIGEFSEVALTEERVEEFPR
ncbi:MAG: hypothetical protein HYX75_20570 [Acidobacteria bacterium]|nr:hypothetical protein [Acidobacteriota bacterium]